MITENVQFFGQPYTVHILKVNSLLGTICSTTTIASVKKTASTSSPQKKNRVTAMLLRHYLTRLLKTQITLDIFGNCGVVIEKQY